MEAIAAVGLAAAIAQFAQLCLGIITETNAVYQSLHNRSSTAAQADPWILLTRNMVKLRATNSMQGADADPELNALYTMAITAGEDLVGLRDKCTCSGRGIRESLKVAICSRRLEREIKALTERLSHLCAAIGVCCAEISRRQLRAIGACQETSFEEMKEKLNSLQRDVKLLADHRTQRPKELGYAWEYGNLAADHILVDCGLGQPFYLPPDLCNSKNVLQSVLGVKFSGKERSKLPGHPQISEGHFLCYNWAETEVVSDSTWSSHFRPGNRVKLSFAMTVFFGLISGKCLRCKKPLSQKTWPTRCNSCKLTVHQEPPENLWTGMHDTDLGLSPDAWHGHQRATRLKSARRQENSMDGREDKDTSKPREDCSEDVDGTGPVMEEVPTIDLVCRRLSVFWAPIYDKTHRYLFCHCIARHSAPSRLYPDAELTFYVPAICPRHNTRGVAFKDYGDRDYYQDGYFDKHYGSYDIFCAVIFCFYPLIWHDLGGEDFFKSDDAIRVKGSMAEAEFEEKYLKYTHDVFKQLMEWHPGEKLFGAQEVDARIKKIVDDWEEKEQDQIERLLGGLTIGEAIEQLDPQRRENLLRDETQIWSELGQIVTGEWDGVPHWKKRRINS